MTSPWRLVDAQLDVPSAQWHLRVAVGIDRYATIPVTANAWYSGAWRAVVDSEVSEMISPGAITYAPRRRHR